MLFDACRRSKGACIVNDVYYSCAVSYGWRGPVHAALWEQPYCCCTCLSWEPGRCVMPGMPAATAFGYVLAFTWPFSSHWRRCSVYLSVNAMHAMPCPCPCISCAVHVLPCRVISCHVLFWAPLHPVLPRTFSWLLLDCMQSEEQLCEASHALSCHAMGLAWPCILTCHVMPCSVFWPAALVPFL